MRISIGRKVIAANTLVILPALIALNLFVVTSFEQYVLKTALDAVLNQTSTAQLQVSRALSQLERVLGNDLFFINRELSSALGMRTQLHYTDGERDVFVDSTDNQIQAEYPLSEDEGLVLASQSGKNYIIDSVNGVMTLSVSFPVFRVSEIVGTGRLFYTLEQEYAHIKALRSIMIVVTAVLFISSSFGLAAITNWVISPIVRLKDKITDFDINSQNEQLEYDYAIKDEVYDLTQSFNTMTVEIRDLIIKLREEKAKQKRFFDNMTHEFKTPLTNIIGYAELTERLSDEHQRVQSMIFIRNESERLLRMVNDLLDCSSWNSLEAYLNFAPNDLTTVMVEALNMLEHRFRNGGIAVRRSFQNEVIALVDRDRIVELILNILDNVIKHSGTNLLEVFLDRVGDTAVLQFRDYGVGIHHSVDTQSAGHGLGLSICRQIVTLHRGTLTIRNLDSGCHIEVTIPLGEVGGAVS